MSLRALGVTVASIAFSGAVSALVTKQNQRPTFRAESNVVVVDVRVTNRGAAVKGLAPADFAVLDNGVGQTVELVAVDSVPLDVTLVVDTSGSVSENSKRFWTEIETVAGTLHPGDRLSLITFAGEIREIFPLTTIPMRLPSQPPGEMGLSKIVDAITWAVMQPGQPGRRHLVAVFTDGIDTYSIATPDQLSAVASRSDAVIAIVLSRKHPLDQSRKGPPVPVFDGIADASGGLLIRDAAPDAVAKSFVQILTSMRDAYVLAYTPRNVPQSEWHALTVRVIKPGSENYVVRARRGYIVTSR